jgi:excisionase family DNA binding protein
MTSCVNSLDELLADPSKVAILPAEMRTNLLARVAALALALTTAFATPTPEGARAHVGGPPPAEQTLLTASQLAKRLNLPESWLRTEERAGRIPSVRAGRYVRFKLADVEAALARRKEARAS